MSDVLCCDNCGEALGFYGIKGHECKPKRVISLDSYLRMQNDWLLSLVKDEVRRGSDGSRMEIATVKSMVDKLLKHNRVEVE